MTSAELSAMLPQWAVRTYRTIVPHAIRVRLHNRHFAHRAACWERIRNTPQSIVALVSPGLRMHLHGDSLLCEMLYFGGFEPDTRNFFDAFLRPGDCFLDIGANVGLYTLAAARIVGPTGEVHAFEPCSQTFARLKTNVAFNRLTCVHCHQVALSDENSSAELTLAHNGFDAWNSLGKPYMGVTTGSETVETVTLDSFAAENGILGRISAVKIDVEGWEHHVLSGARAMLSRPDAPVLCVEFTEEAAQLAQSSCAHLYAMLIELGYSMFTVSADAAAITEFVPQSPFPHVNLLATKNIAAVLDRLNAGERA